MEGTNRNLMSHGMFLFIIGLFTGFAEQHFANVRMGLAAHLEGVMNGIFLLALGAVWNEVRLSLRIKAVAYWAMLYGTYGNWLFTTLAAVFGTAALSPITGSGSQRAAMAGDSRHGRLSYRGNCGPRLLAFRALGAPQESGSLASYLRESPKR